MDSRALELERLRQEVELYSRSAGNLGDYLDHGNPSAEEERRAVELMRSDEERAGQLRAKLAAEVEALRAADERVVAKWAGWHLSWCRRIAAEPASARHRWQNDERDQAVRLHVAGETAQAWERVVRGEERCVSINAYWLPDYEEAAVRLTA